MKAYRKVQRLKVLKMLRIAGLCILLLNIGRLYASSDTCSFKGHSVNAMFLLLPQEIEKFEVYGKGRLNDGDIAVLVSEAPLMKLVNPYSSQLNLVQFSKENKGILDGSIYVFRNFKNYQNHMVKKHLRDVKLIRSFHKIDVNTCFSESNAYLDRGSEFYVSSTCKLENKWFTNKQGVKWNVSPNIDFQSVKKDTRSTPLIKIGIATVTADGQLLHRQLGVSFVDGNSTGYESGFDSVLVDLQTTKNDAYWMLENGQKKVMLGLPAFEKTMEIPMVLQIASLDTVKVSLDMIEQLDHAVYLYDKVTHKKVKLVPEGVTLSLAKGLYTDRFYIAFHERVFDVSETLEAQLEVGYIKNAKIIEIKSEQQVALKEVAVMHLLGKTVASWEGDHLLKGALSFKTVGLLPGVYLVKVTSKNGITVKKLLVK